MARSADGLPGKRMSLIDRQWAGHWSSLLVSPVTAPPVSDVRDLLARWFEEVPTAGLACTVDVTRGVLVPVPPAGRAAFVERMVVAGEDPGADGFDAYQRRHQAAVDGDQGSRIVVGRTSMLVCFNHVIGDGVTFSAFVTAVAALDLDGLRRQEPRATTSTLARATAVGARSSTGRWLRAVRARRAVRPQPTPAGVRRPGPTTPGQVSVMVENAEIARMTRWRKESHPTASLAAVLTSALHRAQLAHGLPADRGGFNALIDVRRYLPEAERGTLGNLAKSLYVATDDIGDPTCVSAAQRALLDSGWTLPSLVVGAVLAARRGRGHAEAAAGDPITMSISVMAVVPGLSGLPWLDGGRGRFSGIGYPVGPGGLSVFVVRMRTHLEVALSYAREAVPDETAARVLDTLHDIPALFEQPPGVNTV